MSKSRITTEKRTARDAPASSRRQSRPAALCAPFTEKLPPIHPGEVLADTLREAGISATSAAIAMALPPSTLTRIIKGQRNVTALIALRIARYFGTSPDIWIRIQTAFDLEIAKDRDGARIERDVRPLSQLQT
jgi:addiction module HigA family antidote